MEEVFESFWHLDGRIFRTLRDLLVPGRLANAYLQGKRVRYIPPLRLFVVLSLITFFVAKLAVHIDAGDKDDDAPRQQASAQVRNNFQQTRTPAEVEALRTRLIEAMKQGRAQMPEHIPGARAGFDAGIANIDKQAQRRLKELDAPVTVAPESGVCGGRIGHRAVHPVRKPDAGVSPTAGRQAGQAHQRQRAAPAGRSAARGQRVLQPRCLRPCSSWCRCSR